MSAGMGDAGVSSDRKALAQAADLYLSVARIARSIRRSGDAGSLSPGQAAALATLSRSGPMRMSDLAAAERVSLPTMSRIVASLERSDYIDRTADPDDGRASLLSPTDDAVAMIKGVTSARIQRFAAALDRLTDDQREALALSLPALETQLADE